MTKLDVIKDAFTEIINFLKDFLAKLSKALPDKVYGWNKDAE